MEQLSGLDAAFVHQDSARTPMHVTAALIYDATNSTLTLPLVERLVRTRLLSEALFQRKLHRVAMDFDTPYWVPAGDIEWSYHLKSNRIPVGGTWESFQEILQNEHSRRMNLQKPLWQLSLITGLNGIPDLPPECQVLILKAHHAAIDGISLARLLARLHGMETANQSGGQWQSSQPNQWDIWSRANLHSLNRQLKLAETMGKLLPGLMRARETRHNAPELPPPLRNRARFNDQVSARRSVGVLLISRADIEHIKRQVRRVTYNDITSAVIAGGLRKYLQKKGELPSGSLAAGMPISLRSSADEPSGSNRIATMSVGLGTELEDPVERLRRIHRYAVAGKKAISALGTGTIMDISDSIAPPVLAEGIRTLAWASRVAPVPVPFHTMISNVPGPEGDQQLDGAPLLACLGLGPVRDNMGLFHTISSTSSRFSISFNACRKLMTNADDYLTCLEAALNDLLEAASTLR